VCESMENNLALKLHGRVCAIKMVPIVNMEDAYTITCEMFDPICVWIKLVRRPCDNEF
jgi:hypothetical protein